MSADPEGQAHPATWWRWVLPLGAIAVIVTLLALPSGSRPGTVLSYSRFMADVTTGTVLAVTINPAGQVTGQLASGHPFSTTIPVALDDRALAGLRAAHHIQVTATAAMS